MSLNSTLKNGEMVSFSLCISLQFQKRITCSRARTFLRPSSSSSVRGHGWSFSSGLTKGEACLVSGLRLGDKITLAGTAAPCELMDSSER